MSAPVLVIGEALVDIVSGGPANGGSPYGNNSGRNGKNGSKATPGGSPANVAVGLARLGLPTELVTRFGTDPHLTGLNITVAFVDKYVLFGASIHYRVLRDHDLPSEGDGHIDVHEQPDSFAVVDFERTQFRCVARGPRNKLLAAVIHPFHGLLRVPLQLLDRIARHIGFGKIGEAGTKGCVSVALHVQRILHGFTPLHRALPDDRCAGCATGLSRVRTLTRSSPVHLIRRAIHEYATAFSS